MYACDRQRTDNNIYHLIKHMLLITQKLTNKIRNGIKILMS